MHHETGPLHILGISLLIPDVVGVFLVFVFGSRLSLEQHLLELALGCILSLFEDGRVDGVTALRQTFVTHHLLHSLGDALIEMGGATA